MSKQKVVIVGGGLGGLSCGFILQEAGYDVTVLEQGIQIGGCLQCFVRKGVKFETGMHFIGSASEGQTMHQLMRCLRLDEDVRLSRLDEEAYNTVVLGGERFRFANGREPFIEQMASYFPREKDNIARYFDVTKKVADASSLSSLVSARRDAAADTEYQLRSINDVLDSLLHDELLKQVIVGDMPLYAAEQDRTPFSLHAYIMDFYNQSAYRIVGGSDVIASSLTRHIEELGGRVLTGKKVVRIHCDAMQAVGVETADECFYPADIVVGTAHPKRMLEMLADTSLLRPAFRNRINGIPQTASAFVVYVKFKEGRMPYMNTNMFGYTGSTVWNCESYTDAEWPKSFLYMHQCHEEEAAWARGGVVISYMKPGDVAQWTGTSVGRRGEDYERFKQERAQRLIALVEKHNPGFADAIEEYYTSTPLTYVDYTGTEDGSIYGVAKDVHLGSSGRVPYRTRIPNLFLAGQNVNSHGMMGVLVGTIVTCTAILGRTPSVLNIK